MRIKLNGIILRLAESVLGVMPRGRLRLRLARKTTFFASLHSTGYYSSAALEKVYVEEAQAHSIPLDVPEEGSVLHVMTYCYKTGGHTRVVERWVEAAAPWEKHSLIFTAGEGQEIPQRLRQAVEKTGGAIIYIPDSPDLVGKGLQLRRIASRYSKVVLHIHMFDVVPLVAFGTEDFRSPVYLFNHADHRFWVGVGIADCVAEFRNWGGIKGLDKKRGLCKTFDIGLPQEEKEIPQYQDRVAMRKKLGLPERGRIILSAGAESKYTPIPGYDFAAMADELLTRLPDAVFVLIGPSDRLFGQCRHRDRIYLPGLLPPAKLYEYMACADLALDSFPMSGATALMDAIICGCPVLSRDNPTGQLSYIMNTPAFCETEQVLVDRAVELLDDDVKLKRHYKHVIEEWRRELSRSPFADKAQELYQTCTDHSVHCNFLRTGGLASPVTDLDVFLHITQNESLPLTFGALSMCVHRISNTIPPNNININDLQQIKNATMLAAPQLQYA